jgi:aldehyde:ferredoxin oxidoreductase
VNCLFTTFALGAPDYADLLSAVTGRSISADDILLIGERIYNLERLINNSLGITGQDDTLPTRLLKEALPEGPGKGQVMKLDELKKEYYKLRGWDNGVPGKAKLKELGITG